jgi:serine/threonine protein kinase
MSSLQLVIISGPDVGRSFALEDDTALLVGRGQDANAQLTDPHCSRQHFQLQVAEGKVLLKDLGSSSGTHVNGSPASETRVGPGDVIQIGQTQLRVEGPGMGETTVAAEAAPAQADFTGAGEALVGTQIHNYQITRILSHGATSVVLHGTDTEKNRDVALKVLLPELATDEEEMQRFIRAMKTMHPIRHPNIIRIYNAGKTNEHVWVAMEYVDGESVAEMIERIGTVGMLDWRDALRVCVHISRALKEAFEHKIIHRNITPENILVRTEDKVAKLGDMMLAKALEGTKVEQITQPGQLIGPIPFMPPERTLGSSDVDCRADIYSLGATVYALLTGRPPVEGGNLPELIMKIRDEEPQRPKDFQLSIDDMFEGVVLRMLAKRPEDRFQEPADLVKELERIAMFQNLEV